MILLDLNQVMISNIMRHIKSSNDYDENLIRHMVLNSIRSYNRQFREVYGKMILCCDNGRSWRKDAYKEYKASRKKHYEKSDIDWSRIFELIEMMKGELKTRLGYHVMEIKSAEADDIIGVLAPLIIREKGEPVLILSGDKDFLQLQKYVGVDQYAPVTKTFLNVDDPDKYLMEHILKGDKIDGVPNFLSPDNTYVESKRQVTLSTKLLNEILDQEFPEGFIEFKYGTDSEELMGFYRNKMMIDLTQVPNDLEEEIIKVYRNVPKIKTKNEILQYFIDYKLRELSSKIEDF